MLVGLRTRVDAVMIGAGTMRAERYGRVVGDPAKREQRERDGLAPDPLMVIVSGRLDLPWDAPLFTEGYGQVLIATVARAPDPPATKTRGQRPAPARRRRPARRCSPSCAPSAASGRCSARAARGCTAS